MEPQERSVDKAAQKMIAKMNKAGQKNAWDRLEAQLPQCGFGKLGICCRICTMGPCRINPFGEEPRVGVCGADADTIVARNFLRAVAAGASAHSDHGRGVAEVFLATARGEAPDYDFRDTVKLYRLAQELGVETKGRSISEIAIDVGEVALAEFGKPEGKQLMARRAPQPRREIWQKLDITPRAVDREVVEALHRTHMGVDQDYKNILMHASRTALADGWGGSMLATELQDVLFGTPYPGRGEVNLGVLKKDEINIIVHGHEPILSEMIVAASQGEDLLAGAKEIGAKGINVAGICCTANELLMRHGVPIAGNFLSQELAIATGAIELMAVDVQCVMQGLAEIAKCFHTKLITTADKARILGVEHVPMEEKTALNTARELVKMAIDNYKNRGEVDIPSEKEKVVVGFSHESINYILGGRFRASYRPLNDNIINGRIRGVVGIVGCSNPKVPQDFTHTTLAKELIRRDVLVLTTGCATIACSKLGLTNPKKALELAGPGLREVCEAVGIPPVLTCGSCVDNSRLLVACTEIVHEGGLGEDISELPAAGACLESITEKAISIGQYFVASGVLVVFAKELLPVSGSENVSDYLFNGIEKDLGGHWAVESDPVKAAEMILEHIESKRDALGINVEKERKLYDMSDRRALSVE
ncbi:MAG TPA: anaerobic carbon-monoxide dehydrogenase catalytic subunit [Sedimentisphaerales bacterium]|nr:anaerobic carbon-monoxide dehydrogenase catalytic subunit [Sedimentisphaerales bacterium]